MDNTHLGKLLVIRFPDIFITSMVVMPFSTFLHHHSEDKSKIITFLLLKPCGTGTHKMVKSVGIQAASQLSTLTTLSADILKKPIASSEVNAKKETSELKKDGLSLKSKK